MCFSKQDVHNKTEVNPYYTYQEILKLAEYNAKEAYPGSTYHIASYDCFLYLHNKDKGLDLGLYSNTKINISIDNMKQLTDAWNSIILILTAHDSIVMQAKVVVPEWVEKFYAQGEMSVVDRDRRMSGAQIILYVYYKSKDEFVIDYDSYIQCLKSIERVFTLNKIMPPKSSFTPVNDIKVGNYFSMTVDVVDPLGTFLSFCSHKSASFSPIIKEFKRRLIPQTCDQLRGNWIPEEKKEEKELKGPIKLA